MLPSSALHVVERTPTKLIVMNPPYYWIGLIFLLIGLFLTLGMFAKGPAGTRAGLNWVALIFAVPFLLFGLAQLTGGTIATFSRERNNLIVVKRYFGISRKLTEVPLPSVRRAVVEGGGRRTQRLVIIAGSGNPVALGGYTTQAGYYEVADAINGFLSQKSAQ